MSDRADDHDVDIVAAGLAFYGLLGFFPALLAVVSIYSLVADPASISQVLTWLATSLPPQARRIVVDGLVDFVKRSDGSLTVSAALSLLAVLWSSSSAMGVLVRAINLACGIEERRSFFRRRKIAILFTLAGVVGVAVVVPLITALPKVFSLLRVDALVAILPPVVLGASALVALTVLFRFAPHGRAPSRHSILIGAAGASLAWLVVSGLYSLYVRYIAAFGSTYGALEGVIVLQFWLYVSSLVLLYGAELTAELDGRKALRKTVEASTSPAEVDPTGVITK